MAQHAKPKSPARRLGSMLTVLVPVVALVAAAAYALQEEAPSIETTDAPRPQVSQTLSAEEVAAPAKAEVKLPDGRKARLAWEKSRITEKVVLVKRRNLARALNRKAKSRKRQLATTTFTVGTFNVLGASHTGAGGNKRGWATGHTRMGYSASLVSNTGVDVIGFQEFEATQLASFQARLGGSFDVFPGNNWGPKSVRFSIAWRSSEWKLVSATPISVTYAGGSRINMPLLLLERLDTGQQVYFFNVHNPASTSRLGNNDRWRAVARGIEIGVINRVRSESGLPLVFTGDMNAREDIFCPLTAATELRAAKGGSSGAGCVPPPRPLGVDWIFGTPDIEFSGYTEIKSGIVNRASDHPFVYTQAVISPSSTDAARKGD